MDQVPPPVRALQIKINATKLSAMNLDLNHFNGDLVHTVKSSCKGKYNYWGGVFRTNLWPKGKEFRILETS